MELVHMADITRETGVNRQTLHNWRNNGIITEVKRGKAGGGKFAYLFEPKTIQECKNFRRLRDLGFSTNQLVIAGEILKEYGHNPFSSGIFLVLKDGETPVGLVKYKDGQFISLYGKYQGERLLPLWDVNE